MAVALYIWWTSGSSGGGQVPGSDEFANGIQAAQSTIGSVGAGQPTQVQCDSVRSSYNAAVAGFGKMQGAGVQAQVLRTAQDKLDTIKKWLDDHCG